MPTALAYTYTSQEEIQRLYSVQGVKAIISDLAGPNVAYMWEELIADATTMIDAYLGAIYNPIDLMNSYWIRQRATWIAAFRLSQRKGQPDLFSQRYEEIMEELVKAQALAILVPNVPTSINMAPSMSNTYVDPRFSIDKIRVYEQISTGPSYAGQSTSYWWPVEWF